MKKQMTLAEIGKGINSKNWRVRCSVFQACAGRSDIPLEWFEKGVNDIDKDVRCNAFEACRSRSDVPLEWLEGGMNNKCKDIRATASKILFDRGYQFPLIRTIEPADKVYKKCLGGVIVVAEIPKTAQVRGSIDGKCRASEAVIVEVITGWDGCAEAVSFHNRELTYKVGDHIIIDNFDHSVGVECSTGYHFFNTIEEAKNYWFNLF